MVINEEPTEARFGPNPYKGVFPCCLTCGNLVDMFGRGHSTTCQFAGVAPESESDAQAVLFEQRAKDATGFTGRLARALEAASPGCGLSFFDDAGVPGIYEIGFTPKGGCRVVFTLWYDSGWKYKVVGNGVYEGNSMPSVYHVSRLMLI